MNILNSERWESGSDFHWYNDFDKENATNSFYNNNILLGTGRYALRLIIEWGRIKYNWRRIWIPSYFCPDVIESVLLTGIDTEFYYDDPIYGCNIYEAKYINGDVILVNNLFGYRSQPNYDSLPRSNIQIIEDHSHDPWSDWSINSSADWCFASLRKSIPVSDGAILWSPVRHQLPPQPQTITNHYQASLEKYVGMLLKAIYLQGDPVEKEYYRGFLTRGEKQLGISKISGITNFSRQQLFKIPIDFIRQRKNQNRDILIAKINNLKTFQILQPDQTPNCCPFSVILYFNTTRIRKIFFDSFVGNKIYPAILWPVKEELNNNLPASNINFSEKMLSLHCDFRYSSEDMNRIAEIIIKELNK